MVASPSNSNSEQALQESSALDSRVMELQSLFELSKLLNSSLNLKSILDNMLLTPMGKMMISKGMVLLNTGHNTFTIETLKGLPRNLISRRLQFEGDITSPTFTDELEDNACLCIAFLKNYGIQLLLPIISNHKKLGFIGFGSKILGKAYTEQELEFLNSLSNIAATSIENGLVFRELNEVNRILDKKNQELNTLFEIGKELNTTLDEDKILNLLLFAIMGEMTVNRCAVFMLKNERMQVMHSKGISDFNEKLMLEDDEALARFLSNINLPILLNDENEIPQDKFYDIFRDNKFRVMIPMRIQDEPGGVIVIGDKITGQPFSEAELEFLSTLGNQAMISLENARLFEETLEMQRMEEELLIARDIQKRLLPKDCPEFDNIEIAAINIPTHQVGGDYYDCIRIDDTHYGIAIGDVSGKGVPASLLMSNAQASLHALVGTGMPTAQLIAKMNDLIYENTTLDKFITFFYGVLDTEKLTFTYCNGGHNPPFFFHADGTCQLLNTGGLLLGMMPGVEYQTATIQLRPGDWIVMFTDGITEAMNDQEEEFDSYRVEQIIRENLETTSKAMISGITNAVEEFVQEISQSDDMTLVVLKVKRV
ncbi:SpoIIE family protein phosphatase [candidate division KSB1 bacterium]|nr:SpoIIE family protein phosphatase [candidate division KSB1 bacterium]